MPSKLIKLQTLIVKSNMAPSKQDKNKEKGWKEKAPNNEDDRKQAATDTTPPPVPTPSGGQKSPPVSHGAKKDSEAMKLPIVSPPRGRKTRAEIKRSKGVVPGW